MYRPYFGLNQLPFKTTPELTMFYREGSREEILQALEYTVVRGDGILKVVGEVGCGKTMTLRLLANELDSSFKLIYVNSPNLSAKDMLLFICTELGIDIADNQQKFSLINLLQKHLLELHSMGNKVVMLIDEAQAMTLDGLEEIRLLTNLETDSDKLLQIVLFGQPELDRALEHPNIRQLKSRITYSIYIPPFSVQDVLSYLNFRMRKSGYSGIDVFNLAAAKRIHKLSRGYPREINVIADKLLMSVFSYQDKIVKAKHFASIESQGNTHKITKIVASIIVVAFVAGGYWVYSASKLESKGLAFLDERLQIGSNPEKNDLNKDPVSLKTYTDQEIVTNPSVNKATVKQDESIKSVDKTVLDMARASEDAEVTSIDKKVSSHLGSVLAPFYQDSVKIVESLDSLGYSVQLATIPVDRLPALQKEFEKMGIDADKVFYILHFIEAEQNENSGFIRLKVFFDKVSDYTSAKQVLQNLPQRLKRSRPFIVSFDSIKKEFSQAIQFVNSVNGGSYVSDSE